MGRRDTRTGCADRGSQHFQSPAAYTWRELSAAGRRHTPLHQRSRRRAGRITRPGCTPGNDRGSCCCSRSRRSCCSLAHCRHLGGRVWARGRIRSGLEPSYAGLVRSGESPRLLFWVWSLTVFLMVVASFFLLWGLTGLSWVAPLASAKW